MSDAQPTPDSLEAHGPLLGPQRALFLEQRVEELRPTLVERPDSALVAEREALGEPFAGFDRDGARTTLRLERDRAIAQRELAEAQAADTAATRAAGRRWTPAAGGLAPGEQITAAWQRSLDVREQLAQLDGVERTLRDEGRHADVWMGRQGEAAVRSIAIDRELSMRGQDRAARFGSVVAHADDATLVALRTELAVAAEERTSGDGRWTGRAVEQAEALSAAVEREIAQRVEFRQAITSAPGVERVPEAARESDVARAAGGSWTPATEADAGPDVGM